MEVVFISLYLTGKKLSNFLNYSCSFEIKAPDKIFYYNHKIINIKLEIREILLVSGLRLYLTTFCLFIKVLSGNFLRSYGKDIINIHHGLLPSFKGGSPSRQVQFSSIGVKFWNFQYFHIFSDLIKNVKVAPQCWQAFEAGVKLIGATSHFVREELDSGPIIEQMVNILIFIIAFNFASNLVYPYFVKLKISVFARERERELRLFYLF